MHRHLKQFETDPTVRQLIWFHTGHTLTESELLEEKEALEDVAQQMEELVEARASADSREPSLGQPGLPGATAPTTGLSDAAPQPPPVWERFFVPRSCVKRKRPPLIMNLARPAPPPTAISAPEIGRILARSDQNDWSNAVGHD
jgi:hypothetical protein